MIIVPVVQNTFEWLQARAGIATASEFDQLLTPEFKVRTGDMPKTYLARKLTEKWFGGPVAGACVLDMEIGKVLEEEALPFYELETGETITRVGFITTDDSTAGASPDGLIGDYSGIEIKCPLATTHMRYLIDGGLPKDYRAQVFGSMFVTGRDQWKFMSYCRGLPPLIVSVQMEESIRAEIADALELFNAKMNIEWDEVCEKNGGPPKRMKVVPNPFPKIDPISIELADVPH